MNINHALFEQIRNMTYKYGFAPWNVEKFLIEPQDFLIRQSNAIEIIEGIMTAHGKEKLHRHVVQLAKVEHGIRELEPWVRDHVVHALLSFLLGISIQEYFLSAKGVRIDSFQWKLAGMFHDIGYPIQIAKDLMVQYSDQINDIKRDLSIDRPDIFFKVIPSGIEELQNGINSLAKIQDCLDEWGLNIDVFREYEIMLDSGKVCHGMISALSVLYVIDMMYQKYNPLREQKDIFEPDSINWNQNYFDKDVIPACAAIFIHNLPSRCFQDTKINWESAPLAYLLRLSDCLQDWERPSAEDPHGANADEFSIEVRRGTIYFGVADPARRSNLEAQLDLVLVRESIEFMGV